MIRYVITVRAPGSSHQHELTIPEGAEVDIWPERERNAGLPDDKSEVESCFGAEHLTVEDVIERVRGVK